MAIWQLGIALVPREPIVVRFGAAPAVLPDGDDDWMWTWQPPEDYPAVIEEFTQPYPSWSAEIRMWGAESGDRIHVVHEEERVVGIACRLDLRAFSTGFARGLLRLARHCDCMLLTGGARLIAPRWKHLLETVRASDELRFVRDPLDFFRRLSGGEAEA